MYASGGISKKFTSRFSAYRSANQGGVVTATWSKVLLDAVLYDNAGEFADNQFTPAVNGYYHFDGQIELQNPGTDKVWEIAIYKSGNMVAHAKDTIDGTGHDAQGVAKDLYLTTDDYVELYVYHTNAANRTVNGTHPYTYLTGHRFA